MFTRALYRPVRLLDQAHDEGNFKNLKHNNCLNTRNVTLALQYMEVLCSTAQVAHARYMSICCMLLGNSRNICIILCEENGRISKK